MPKAGKDKADIIHQVCRFGNRLQSFCLGYISFENNQVGKLAFVIEDRGEDHFLLVQSMVFALIDKLTMPFFSLFQGLIHLFPYSISIIRCMELLNFLVKQFML